jgi:hypothetical protein
MAIQRGRNVLARQPLETEAIRQENVLRQRAIDADQQPIMDAEKAVDLWGKVRDLATPENWSTLHGILTSAGLPNVPAEYNAAWIKETDDEAKEYKPMSTIGKLISDRNEMIKQNPNDPNIKDFDLAIKKSVTAKGMSIKTNPDGTFEIIQGELPTGPEQGRPLTKGAQTAAEKQLFTIDTSLNRVEGIIRNYKPEFQQLGSRWANWMTATKEKLGQDVSKDDKKNLVEFSRYRKQAVSFLNEEIKRITGAQMSEKEAGRLTKGLPNPGTGLFDGDSPPEFISALKVVYQDLLMSKARYNWYLNNGYDESEIKGLLSSDKQMSLADIYDKVNQRAAQIEKKLRERVPQGGEMPDFRSEVKNILKAEFGI